MKTPKNLSMKFIRYFLLWGCPRMRSELATYQLKDVAQAWYVQWRDNRTLSGGPVTWEVFKETFLDRFIPREMREEKGVEFINLFQGGKSVHEYSLEFIKLSKYAPYLVSYPRE